MRKILWLLLLPLFSQAQVTFNHFYDFDVNYGPAVFRNIIKTADGGYAMIGSLYFTPWNEFDQNGNEVFNYTNDIVLVKTDANHNVEWSKVFYSLIDFTYEEAGIKIKEKPGGGFVLLTETEDPLNIYYLGRPANLISIDAAGNVIWTRSFSATTGYDKPFDFIIDNDNSIVVVGSSNFNAASRKPWAFKTDSTGLLLWGNTYTSSNGEFRSIVKAASGGYVVAGKRSTDVMLMRMTSSGTNIWTRTYTTAAAEGAQVVINSGAGYAMLVNNTTAGSSQLLQTDSSGNTTSVKSYLQLNGVSLIRNGNTFLITGNQTTAAILSFTTDLTGNITSNVRKYAVPTFFVTPFDALLNGTEQYICGNAGSEAWLIKTDINTGFSGGCFNSTTTLTVQSASFTFATINPSVNNLFMEEDIDALIIDEYIAINEYPICSCTQAQVDITTPASGFCSGDSITLNATSNAAYQYQWYKNGSIIPGAISTALTINQQASYFVSVTSICGSDSSSVVTPLELPKPILNTISTDSAFVGDTIHVTGSNFLNLISVSLNTAAFFNVQDNNHADVIIPPNAFSSPIEFVRSNGCKGYSPTIVVLNPSQLKISVFIEGLYLGAGQSNSDSLIVTLYTTTSPPQPVYSFKELLNSDGLVSIDLPYFLSGNYYYLSVRTWNSIETWTRDPILIESVTSVNFTGQ